VPRAVTSDCSALGDCAAAYFPKLAVDAAPIVLSAIEKGGKMTSTTGYIPIRNDGGGVLSWNVTIAYQSGSGWLFVDNSAGQNFGSVRVWSDTTSLVAGSYHATITINAGGAGSQTIPLTLNVTPAPVVVTPPAPAPSVTVSKVVNAATFANTPLVAGSLATVMGSHLSGKSVTVTFDGAPATVFYSSDSQINLQVPAALGTKSSASVVVTADGSSSAPVTVSLVTAWPEIFAHGVLNQDYAENTSGSPAAAGSALQIFATGIPKSATVTVQFGGRTLTPLFAGDAPGFPGLQQVNVAVPAGAASTSLSLCADGACSTAYPVSVR
jgi:uncharacterized protein (TIGR03437 family)